MGSETDEMTVVNSALKVRQVTMMVVLSLSGFAAVETDASVVRHLAVEICASVLLPLPSCLRYMVGP